jgi:hypothetical protein
MNKSFKQGKKKKIERKKRAVGAMVSTHADVKG